MYKTVTRNHRKRKKLTGTWFLETTTMFAPGEESTAEDTFAEAESMREGRKRGDHRLLYDHRWGEVDDLTNEDELRAGLIEAYGDAVEWIDIDGLINEFWDSRNDPVDSRRYFLNAQTSTSDAWLTAQEWDGCGRPDRQLQDRDFVCLGLDGSVNEDSTCLVACRISDGHLELLDCFEKPPGRLGEGWQVDRIAVDAAVAHAMERFEVAGFYMDPAHWQDYADKFSAEFGEKMQVKATQSRPLEWWTNKPTRMVAALERFHEAVVDRRVSFTPAADRAGRTAELAVTLRRHALNARRRPSRAGLGIAKEFPKSPKKIDGIMSAVLAFEARGDAIAIGAKPRAARVYAAKRIR